MKTLLMGLLMVAGVAWAEPAFVSENVGCLVYTSRGDFLQIPGRLVMTQPLLATSPDAGPMHIHCEGDQGFPAGRLIRFDWTCQNSDLTPVGPFNELITPGGHIAADCHIQR